MKITKRQLKRIIKEERARLAEQMGDPAAAGIAAARRDSTPGNTEHGIFDENYLQNMIHEEIMDYLNTAGPRPGRRNVYLTANEAKAIERAINAAANAAVMDLVED
tara:strand:- start:196 stop:513 length:318 start_codon:yes stop_codon:yes gene_type:complete